MPARCVAVPRVTAARPRRSGDRGARWYGSVYPLRPFAALSSRRIQAHNPPVTPRRLHALLGALVAVPLLATCSSVSEISQGLVIAIAADPPTNPQHDADGSLIVNTDLGYRVTVTRAYLVSTSLEIFACQGIQMGTLRGSPKPPATGLRRASSPAPQGIQIAARLWRRWVIGRAEAHTLDAPTRMGTAFVESLTGTGTGTDTAVERHELGEIKPPPGRYCRAVYTASAADRDAIGMPPDRVAIGNTVYLEGTFQRQPADSPRPFTVSSSAPFTVEEDIAAIDLFGGTPTPTLVIRKQADHWFDGVDFELHPPRVIAREVLDNMRGSIRLERP
jgi:hypothetical protein